jgi:protoporphyrin/coproporphyrin ferrochelatase
VAATRRAVVLFQLGGPGTQEAVEPFLFNLFCDPDIIDLPLAFLFREPLARFIARKRAPIAKKLYASIGGGSPILAQTQMQAAALRSMLAARGHDMPVEIAMRYWHPRAEQVIRTLLDDGIEDVVLLPLYPHYSKATTGSSMREWNDLVPHLHAERLHTTLIRSYHDHPLYVRSLVERVNEALERVPEPDRRKVHLLFSAHGTPMKLVRNGDPYSHHIRRTYELVLEQGNFGLPHHLCFQSKVGPQKWLTPSLVEAVKTLAEENVSHVIVIPIAFVTDHIETLSEISIEARSEAMNLGITYFDMTAPLLTSTPFIECLCDLVLHPPHTSP